MVYILTFIAFLVAIANRLMTGTMSIPGKMPVQTASPLSTWTSDTIKCALLSVDPATAGYVQDTTIFWATLQGSEVANGNGYTTGGITLTGKSVTYDATTNRNRYLAAALVWTGTGTGISAKGAVYYKDTGSAATSPIVAVHDFQATLVAAGGGTLTETPDATDGVFYGAPA